MESHEFESAVRSVLFDNFYTDAHEEHIRRIVRNYMDQRVHEGLLLRMDLLVNEIIRELDRIVRDVDPGNALGIRLLQCKAVGDHQIEGDIHAVVPLISVIVSGTEPPPAAKRSRAY